MKEKTPLFIAGDAVGRMRRAAFPIRFLKYSVLPAAVVMAVSLCVAVDAYSPRQPSGEEAAAEPTRAYIQKLMYDINRIKAKLAEVSTLEEKLRHLAKIDLDADTGIDGMGGPFPEDMDPKTEMQNRSGELLTEMRAQVLRLHKASVHREENLETLLEILKRQQEIFERTPTGRPAPGRISSGYGWRRSPFDGKREFHRGIDIAVHRGTSIQAPADGKVIAASTGGGLGKIMVIDHGHGVVTRYGHLSRILKKPGEPVRRGETIATVGNTGRSTGPHLHYEILIGGSPVNPREFMFD